MRLVGEQLSVDGYVRVSRVGGRRGERFISPAVQRELIESWARARGVRVLEVFEEFDESGGRADRPLLERALGRVERGVSQGIVVSKVDRFGRSLISGLAAIERVRVAGGTFFSIQDGLDTSTDTGRLVLRIMLSLGEWESERIRASWEQAHARAIARGVYGGGRDAPVGYRCTRSSRLRPDPATSGVVAEVFRRRAGGESVASLAAWLEAVGVTTGAGNPGWELTTLAKLLSNRVYLGEVRWGSYVNGGAHPALVDAATWQAAQHPKRVIVRRDRRPALLAQGLVRCAGCSMTMSRVWQPKAGADYYRCRRHSAAGPCPTPAAIAADYLDPYIEECVFDVLRRRRRAPAADLAQAEAALARADAALCRYRDSDRILDTLGRDAFLAGLAARTARVRSARLRIAAIRDAHWIHTLPPVVELERQWLDMDDRARRSIIAGVIDCVFVSPGRLRVEDRVTVCRAGTAPPLPTSGSHNGGEARPFIARRKHHLPAPKPWTTDRIERELADFLQGKRVWPTSFDFAAAGRRRLYDQVVRHAGLRCWAHHVGLPIIAPSRTRESWTEPRIRVALSLYLRRKRHWPSRAQFEADGLVTLHNAIAHHGGARRWSEELASGLTPTQRTALRVTH